MNEDKEITPAEYRKRVFEMFASCTPRHILIEICKDLCKTPLPWSKMQHAEIVEHYVSGALSECDLDDLLDARTAIRTINGFMGY